MRAGFFIPLLFAAAVMAGQSPAPPSIPPNELVRKVVANEIQADEQDHSHWMYQVVTNVPAPRKTTAVVETRNGDVNYLEEIDGRPLSPQQKRAEDQRVQRFVNDPEQQSKARRDGAADDQKTSKMFAMLPEAFIFQYAGQYAGGSKDTIKLDFHPNPDFTSHSADAYVFHKMDGFVIINTRQNRLVEISGRLTNGVEFLGGLLGHLDPGGTFDVRREEIAPGHWAITKLKVNMNGKALFFKNISVQQDEVHSHFQRIPDSITMTQAETMAQKGASASATPGG
jgi:hypothetical protein